MSQTDMKDLFMFSGIIEAQSQVKKVTHGDKTLKLTFDRPSDFDDLKLGDSISCNGVCLTVEEFSTSTFQISLGFETLKVTSWDECFLKDQTFNLERSLKFGDRIHGHLVTGHVDEMVPLVSKNWQGESLVMVFKVSKKASPYIWNKGSVTLNGVSLTINKVEGLDFEVCLVPETLRQTNLGQVEIGARVCFEIDNFARAFFRYFENQKLNQKLEGKGESNEPHL